MRSLVLLGLVLLAVVVVQAKKEIGKDADVQIQAANGQFPRICVKKCGKCIVLLKAKDKGGNSKGGVFIRNNKAEDEDVKGWVVKPGKIIAKLNNQLVSNGQIGEDKLFESVTFSRSFSQKSFPAGKDGTDLIYARCVDIEGKLSIPSAANPTFKLTACIFPEDGTIQVEDEELEIKACSIKYNIEANNLDFVQFDEIDIDLFFRPAMKKGLGANAFEPGRKSRGKPRRRQCKKPDGSSCMKNDEFEIDEDGAIALFAKKLQATDISAQTTVEIDVPVGEKEVDEATHKVPAITVGFKKPATHTNGKKWRFVYDPLFTASATHQYFFSLAIMAMSAAFAWLF